MTPDDSSVLQLILRRLDELEKRLDGVATRDDLAKLVSLDLYQEARRSDTRASEDMARRLGALEQDVRVVREESTKRAITEASALAAAQANTSNQNGTSSTAVGLAKQANEAVSRLKDLMLGGLATAVIYLLINALGHR